MAKIAILLSGLHSGGAERAMLNLSDGFVRRGFQVDMVLVSAEGAFLPQLDPGVHLVNLGKKRVLSAIPSLLRYLRREQPDAVISNLPPQNIAIMLVRPFVNPKPRLVIVEQNDIALASAHGIRFWGKYYPLILRLLHTPVVTVVAVSSGVADGLVSKAHLSRNTIKVIYNPIVTPKIAEYADVKIDHPWFAKGQPPLIVAVGRLTEQKDYPTLLHAFAGLRLRRPVHLIILGEGKMRQNLEAMVTELGITTDVAFTGFQSNPYVFMRHASTFVLSSAWEGFGNVLVEALACGTQVVSTNCPSGPAEILDGGKYGWLVPVGDVSALTDAMEAALDHPMDKKMLVERAQTFSVDVAVTGYLRVLGLEK